MTRARRLCALLLVALTVCASGASFADEAPARSADVSAVNQKQTARPLPLAVPSEPGDARRVSSGQPQLRQERITRFDVTAQVNPDASITVREDLEFVAAGNKIRRGLVRSIPVFYRSADGQRLGVGLNVLSTSVDGEDLKWEAKDKRGRRNIRIGKPDRRLSPGAHRLSLIYTMTKMLGFFETHDELYWNVTGNEWDMPIESASFRLKLPGREYGEGFSAVAWYTGRSGSTDRTGARETADRTTVTTRALRPGEGLTVVYAWPKGVVARPELSKIDRFDAFAWAHGSAIFNWLAGLGLAVAAALLGFAGWKAAPNHTGETAPIPLFHAPKDLPPAQARLIHSGETDSRALSAEIIRLAIDGWLKITGSREDGYTLEKIARPSPPDDPAQAKLLETLFPNGEERLPLKNKEHERFQAAGEVVASIADADALFANKNGALLGAFLVMLAGFFFAAAFIFVTDSGTKVQYAGALFALVTCWVALYAAVKGLGDNLFGPITPIGAFFRLFLPVAIGAYAMLRHEPRGFFYGLPVLLALCAAMPLRKRLVFWTEAGRKKLEQTQGLEMFIRAAEKDRLELLNSPDDTPELFEELLPYAVATDSVVNWTGRFAGVLEAASYQPEWYAMPCRSAHFTAGDFTDGFSSLSGNLSTSLRSASVKSGLFGGHAGGGFGGGGGHGW